MLSDTVGLALGASGTVEYKIAIVLELPSNYWPAFVIACNLIKYFVPRLDVMNPLIVEVKLAGLDPNSAAFTWVVGDEPVPPLFLNNFQPFN